KRKADEKRAEVQRKAAPSKAADQATTTTPDASISTTQSKPAKKRKKLQVVTDDEAAPLERPISDVKKQKTASKDDMQVKNGVARQAIEHVEPPAKDADDVDGVSDAGPQKKKKKKAGMMKQLAAQELQRNKDAARKLKADQKAAAKQQKADAKILKKDQVPISTKKKSTKKPSKKPTTDQPPLDHGDSSADDAAMAPLAVQPKTSAVKQHWEPADDSSDDEAAGLSLFDRMAQKMRQQILAKDNSTTPPLSNQMPKPARQPPPPPSVAADATPKRSILSSIFSLPQLKKP
ncbi:hypothetical protein DYB38_012960, partial [Aphanomyces astaci]